MYPDFPEWLAFRTSRLMGSSVSAAERASGGYTPAERWVVALRDGRRVFVKSGHNTEESAVANWLRSEHQAYDAIRASFMARLLAWEDDAERPLLVLEDLSDARWPPPWIEGDVERISNVLTEIGRTAPPEWAPSIESREREHLSGWQRVDLDPEPFLSLGLCDRDWLDAALPALVEASESAPLAGDSLVHFDVRSDNLCLRTGGALIVDWNWCGRGNPDLDRLLWLPSLHAEGGPAPWEVVEDSGGIAALLAGFLASRAGLSGAGLAAERRRLQSTLLRSALPWAVKELGLPVPNSPAGGSH